MCVMSQVKFGQGWRKHLHRTKQTSLIIQNYYSASQMKPNEPDCACWVLAVIRRSLNMLKNRVRTL